MQWRKVHLITQCVAGKSREPKQHMKIANHSKASIDELFKNWKANLIRESKGSGNQCAQIVYSSQYWTIFWGLAKLISGEVGPGKRWVVSTGYGLIQTSQEIAPYHATFSQRQDDSIKVNNSSSGTDDGKRWWSLLSNDRVLKNRFGQGMLHMNTRSLRSLIEITPPFELLVFILSPAYMKALEEDLGETPDLWTYENVLIFSSVKLTKKDPRLPRTIRISELDAEALRRREKYQVNNTTLPLKFIDYMVAKLGVRNFTVETIRDQQKKLRGRMSVKKYDHRQPQSDDQVLKFIRKEVKLKDYKGYSPLLRVLRDSGFQCEMRRFSGLYSQVKNGNNK